jgi:hypothetical protein
VTIKGTDGKSYSVEQLAAELSCINWANGIESSLSENATGACSRRSGARSRP